jgi:hypothetical protein
LTLAICIECGRTKFGAYTRCSCGYNPAGDEEALAKSLLLTDHYLSAEALEQIGQAISQGRRLRFDPDQRQASIRIVRETSREVGPKLDPMDTIIPPNGAEDCKVAGRRGALGPEIAANPRSSTRPGPYPSASGKTWRAEQPPGTREPFPNNPISIVPIPPAPPCKEQGRRE